MKKTVFAALTAASFTALVSCNQSAKPMASNPLIGQWKIDSIASPDNNMIGVILLASTLNDSATFDMNITADSISLHQKDTVTKTGYTFNSNTNQLLLQEDPTVLQYQPISPAYIKLTATDSTTMYLRKR